MYEKRWWRGTSLMNTSSQVFYKSSQKKCNILSAWGIYGQSWSEGHAMHSFYGHCFWRSTIVTTSSGLACTGFCSIWEGTIETLLYLRSFSVYGSSYSSSVRNLVQTENAFEYELKDLSNTKLPIIPSMNYIFNVCIGPRPCAFAVYGMTGRIHTGQV